MLVEERRKRLLEEDLRREPPKEELLILTGSIPMLKTVMGTPGLRIAIHGGEPHPGTGALVGPLALGSLEKMRFDWAIISALGVMQDEDGVYVSNPEEVAVKTTYLERARRRALAVDRSKFGVGGAYLLSSLSGFDAIVTEDGIEKAKRA